MDLKLSNPWLIGSILAIVIFFNFRDTAAMGLDAATDSDPFYRWDKLFKRYGASYGVPWKWLKAICMNESSLGTHPRVKRGLEAPWDIEGSKSEDGLSWGLMQVTLRTARAIEGVSIDAKFLNDPDNSVRLAAELVSQLIQRYGINDREAIIRDYNGGPRRGPMTIPYYAKFLGHLAIVLAKHPGPELEGYQNG